MQEKEISEKNIILIDWLSFTSKIHTPEDIMSLLGISDANWQKMKGMHGYQDRYYYESISIHYNGRDDMGVWCEMSGKGCRAYETLGKCDFVGLFKLILDNIKDMNFTRIDVAFDDHEGILPLETMAKDALAMNFVSPFGKGEVIMPLTQEEGITINHGSKKSEIFIRIYDKAKERGFLDTHWVRLEIQMRRDRARVFAEKMLERESIGELFSGVLNVYLRYVKPGNDMKKSRWATRLYWAKLLLSSEKISVVEEVGMEYNFSNLYNSIWQIAGAIYTFLRIKGIYTLIDEVDSIVKNRGLNPKHEQLLREYGKQRTEDVV